MTTTTQVVSEDEVGREREDLEEGEGKNGANTQTIPEVDDEQDIRNSIPISKRHQQQQVNPVAQRTTALTPFHLKVLC